MTNMDGEREGEIVTWDERNGGSHHRHERHACKREVARPTESCTIWFTAIILNILESDSTANADTLDADVGHAHVEESDIG